MTLVRFTRKLITAPFLLTSKALNGLSLHVGGDQTRRRQKAQQIASTMLQPGR